MGSIHAHPPPKLYTQIARQQSGERPSKRSQRSIEKATATLGRIAQEEEGAPSPEEPPSPAFPPHTHQAFQQAPPPITQQFSTHLDALADAAAEVDANDIPAPGIKPKQPRGANRPIYEQAANSGLPPRSRGDPTPNTRRSRKSREGSSPAVKTGGGGGGGGGGAVADVQPMSDVQALAASLGMPPAVGMLRCAVQLLCMCVHTLKYSASLCHRTPITRTSINPPYPSLL